MHVFSYSNPTTIYFGKGQIIAARRAIPADRKILVLYGGGSVKRNTVLDQVRAALSKHEFTEFGGIEPNPSYETLMGAIELARRENIDFILAVGGGSVIDGAKFVAAAAPYEGGDPWDIIEKHAPITKVLPIATVLTLPGTGSESNANAVISHHHKGQKRAFIHPLLYPKFSILDPSATFSLPPRQIGNGVVDSFVHIVEQYLNVAEHAMVQDRYSESLLRTLIEEGPVTLAHPLDYDARANVMWAANQALNGLIGVGVTEDWSTHAIGHELTALYGLDHAQSLAAVLTQNWQTTRAKRHDKLALFARQVWMAKDADDEKAIDRAIKKTTEFFETMGLKSSLKQLGIEAAVVDKVPDRLREQGMEAIGVNGAVTLPVVKEILEASLK